MSTDAFPIRFEIPDWSGALHLYQATYIPARRGIPLSLELVKSLGEPLMAAFGSLGGDGTEEVDLKALGGALGPALRGVDPAVLGDLFQTLLSGVLRDSTKIEGPTFDKVYRGNYGEMYQAVWHIVMGNRLIPLPGTFSPPTE